MKIYTSYYAKTNKLIKNNITPISVSLFNPKRLKNEIKCSLKYLAPRYKMLQMSESQYIPKYLDILKNINPKTVIEDIKQASKGQDVALMCYEIPTDFCHRHMIADWLNKKTEYKIEEWSDEVVQPEINQTKLF
tara:strand:+ start:5949 stop:6350 length:402 start_codon:yes stop_codon:yes gene_type:complete